jgi:hypothetical protein
MMISFAVLDGRATCTRWTFHQRQFCDEQGERHDGPDVHDSLLSMLAVEGRAAVGDHSILCLGVATLLRPTNDVPCGNSTTSAAPHHSAFRSAVKRETRRWSALILLNPGEKFGAAR